MFVNNIPGDSIGTRVMIRVIHPFWEIMNRVDWITIWILNFIVIYKDDLSQIYQNIVMFVMSLDQEGTFTASLLSYQSKVIALK